LTASRPVRASQHPPALPSRLAGASPAPSSIVDCALIGARRTPSGQTSHRQLDQSISYGVSDAPTAGTLPTPSVPRISCTRTARLPHVESCGRKKINRHGARTDFDSRRFEIRTRQMSATPADFMGSPSEAEHVAGLKRDDVLAVGTIRAGAASNSSHAY